MKQSVWFVEGLDQVQPQDTLKSVLLSQIGEAVPCWGWWLRISRSTVVQVQASSASLIKRSCIIKNSPSGGLIHEPTDCCLCTAAIVIVPFMCLLYLTLLSLYIVFVSWWLLLFFFGVFFFQMGLKSLWNQRRSTVISDRVALQEHREKLITFKFRERILHLFYNCIEVGTEEKERFSLLVVLNPTVLCVLSFI